MKNLSKTTLAIIIIGVLSIASGLYLALTGDKHLNAYLGIFTGVVLVGTGWIHHWKEINKER